MKGIVMTDDVNVKSDHLPVEMEIILPESVRIGS